MTTTANPLLENCCNPCCGDGGCNNKGAVNIMSTNPDCLSVDTSECGVVKLEPVCPPVVVAGDETIEVISEDCGEEEKCSKKYKVYSKCKDELVKACPNDTTPGTLSEKLEAGTGITLTEVGCSGGTNSSIRISIDEDELPNPEVPPIEVNNLSKLITVTPGGDDGHTLTIRDNTESTYDNMCCIGFETTQNFTVGLDDHGDSVEAKFMGEDGRYRSICTGNPDMASSKGLKILADGYYRLFGQITVRNNTDNETYINLGRGLLRIDGAKDSQGNLVRPELDKRYLSTAKHGAYTRQVLLSAAGSIDVSNDGEISSGGSGTGQAKTGFNGPWATFNIDCLVDLRAGDTVTLGYRPQTDMEAGENKTVGFSFVGKDDGSTTAGYRALFGGTLLGCYQLAPKLFQQDAPNKIYESF